MAPKSAFRKYNLHNIMKQGEDEKLLQALQHAQLLGKVLASIVMLEVETQILA